MNQPRELLGVVIEPDPWPDAPPSCYQVSAADGEVLGTGSWPKCSRIRIEHLRGRFGASLSNVRMPTLGGKQLWADVFVSCGWRIQESLVKEAHHRLLDSGDRRVAWGTFEACRVAFEARRLSLGLRPRSAHAVVMLHGLIRAKDSMGLLADAFAEAGYEVVNINYPSTRRHIDEHATNLDRVLDGIWGVETISFVTHSMGAMVVRALMARESASVWRQALSVDRFLMIFPPSRGAMKASEWKDNRLARMVMGPPLQELTPEEAPRIPAPPCRFAIIAGARDTTVKLEEAELPGAEFVRVLDVEHTFGMRNPSVIEAALQYIDA